MKRMMLALALLAAAVIGCGSNETNPGTDNGIGDQPDVVDVAEQDTAGQGDVAGQPDQVDMPDTALADATDTAATPDIAVSDDGDVAVGNDVISDVNAPEVAVPAMNEGLQYNGSIIMVREPV